MLLTLEILLLQELIQAVSPTVTVDLVNLK
jgi:hypothetical protein